MRSRAVSATRPGAAVALLLALTAGLTLPSVEAAAKTRLASGAAARIAAIRAAPDLRRALALIRKMPELRRVAHKGRRTIATKSYQWMTEKPLTRNGIEYSIQASSTGGNVKLGLAKSRMSSRATSPYSWSPWRGSSSSRTITRSKLSVPFFTLTERKLGRMKLGFTPAGLAEGVERLLSDDRR